MNVTSIIVGLIILIVLVGAFFYTWKTNHKTAIPEGAFETPPQCSGCANKGCGNYKEANE